MNHHPPIRICISVLLLIMIGVQFFVPLSANAFPVFETNPVLVGPVNKTGPYKFFADLAARIIAGTLIRAMTNQVISWIQGGDAGFVSNLDQEFRRVADEAGGEFLNNLADADLCSVDLSRFLRFSLRTPGLRQRFACTVTEIVQDVNTYFENFANGGWPAFITMSLQPQNNPYGAYFIGLDAKLAAESRAKTLLESKYQAGRGFVGFQVPKQVCREVSVGSISDVGEPEGGSTIARSAASSIEGGEVGTVVTDTGRRQICNTEYETKTPGAVVADTLSKTLNVGYDFTIVADEINEAIASIANALINKLISSTFSISSGGRTVSGSGLLDRGLGRLPELTPQDVGAERFIQQIDDGISTSHAAIKTLTNTIAATARELASTTPASDDPRRQTLADAERKKNDLLVTQFDLLLLRNSLVDTARASDFAIRVQSLNSILTRLNDILGTVENVPLPAPTSGDLQRDTLVILAETRTTVSNEIRVLRDAVADINRRTATSTATAADALTRLNERKQAAEGQITLFEIALGRTAEIQNDLREARTEEVRTATVREATRELTAINQNLQRSGTIVRQVHSLLGLIPAPQQTQTTIAPPTNGGPGEGGETGR